MMDRRLGRIARPLTRSVRAASDRWDAVGVRRQADRLLQGRGDWEIGPFHRARSGTRIARMRSAGDMREAILKITDAQDGARGLERERLVLSALAAERRLAGLHPLLPEVLDAGSEGRWSFLVQRALPGEPATALLARQRDAILSEASAAAARLHDVTAISHAVATPDVEDWIERPVRTLRALVGPRAGSSEARRIDRLRAEVGPAVEGAIVPLGWIHGDLWSDNLLVNAQSGRITGIVDWDSAVHAGLAVHDQLHLVLYSRKILEGTQIGTEICRALGPEPRWDATELSALSAGTDALPGPDVASRRRLGVLLYWLRLVVVNLIRQQGTTRSRRWLDDNVRAVLACI
jgi:aminoglycoside phosphotransferase